MHPKKASVKCFSVHCMVYEMHNSNISIIGCCVNIRNWLYVFVANGSLFFR